LRDAAKAGAFEKAVGPHLRAAYNLARWLLRGSADVEDVLQEATVRAFRHFDSFRGGNARGWLLAIVRNACWSWMSRKGVSVQELDEQREAAAVLTLQREIGRAHV